MRTVIETVIGILAVAAFMIVSASVVLTIATTGASAQTCETRCIQRAFGSGECIAWETQCYDD